MSRYVVVELMPGGACALAVALSPDADPRLTRLCSRSELDAIALALNDRATDRRFVGSRTDTGARRPKRRNGKTVTK